MESQLPHPPLSSICCPLLPPRIPLPRKVYVILRHLCHLCTPLGGSPPPIAKQDASLSSLHPLPLFFARANATMLVVVRRYPKYSRPSLPLLLIPLSPCVVRDQGRQESIRLRALLLPHLWLGSGASIAIGRGGSRNLFPSHLCPPSSRTLIPLLWVDWSTLFVYFIGSTHLSTSELV